jgi:TctA family transporter
MMIGAMMIHNIVPGPEVMSRNADLFWGLVASMWIGNLLLVVINLPLIGLWVSFLRIPYAYLFLAILVFSMIGLYSITNSSVQIFMAAGFGVLGYAVNRLGCEPAPLLLGFILGPMIEVYARRALLLSHGDPSVFLTEPLSAVLLLTALGLLASVLSPSIRRRREEVFAEE